MNGQKIAEIKVICPYCKNTLEKKPQRKTKCPSCNNYIFIRTLPKTRERVLVTEEEVKEINKQWKRINFINEWLKYLEPYEVNLKRFEDQKDKLTKAFGKEA